MAIWTDKLFVFAVVHAKRYPATNSCRSEEHCTPTPSRTSEFLAGYHWRCAVAKWAAPCHIFVTFVHVHNIWWGVWVMMVVLWLIIVVLRDWLSIGRLIADPWIGIGSWVLAMAANFIVLFRIWSGVEFAPLCTFRVLSTHRPINFLWLPIYYKNEIQYSKIIKNDHFRLMDQLNHQT